MQTIPKVVHFIWLGSCLPDKYQNNIQTWVQHNPEYTFNLWIDSAALWLETVDADVAYIEEFCRTNKIILQDVACLNCFLEFCALPMYNDWLNGVDKTYAFAADVLRLKILNEFGGIYSDLDTKCNQPLGDFSNKCGFYAWGNSQYITDNCVLAAVEHHPVLQMCIDEMNNLYTKLILFTLCRDAKVIRRGIFGLDPNVTQPQGKVNIDKQKYWEDWAYDKLRFTDPHNDSRRAGLFGAPVSYHIMNVYIRENYGDEELKNCIFLQNAKVSHSRDNSWVSLISNLDHVRGMQISDEELDKVRLNDRLAIARGKCKKLHV